ncbi:hypothetical protein DPM19_24550 [Actinomadura craniellae]|uniref:DNA-binding protein n=1 Tax=Actinomadura craniellae TaxID=2231787 RepID=A0A365H0J4_9ACTN|nr:hypothetical protein [Actinomadura craniellae]RAY12538.1 hypothetical protein DPM19_24550 [Actinomadura craniellae]
MSTLPADPSSSALYLDWVRVHAPEWEKDAERLLDKVREGIGRAYSKPGRFIDDMKMHARQLPAEHLPWFWDTVGQRLTTRTPRPAGTAYGLAREAEREHRLPIDPDHHLANALRFARAGALAGKELRAHQQWLAGAFPAGRAHEEFLRFVRAWSASGAPPAADLHTRLRASARAAGLGDDEVARVLAEMLAGAKGVEVPNGLLDGAAKLFATFPVDDGVRQALVDLFPPTNTDGAAFLRLLLASGTVAAMADGKVTPDGGLARWLGRYTYHYSYQRASGGAMQRSLPDELYEVLPRLAPRLRAAGIPVRLHESRYRITNFDADLVDACLAEGITVEDPGPDVRLDLWGDRSRRDLKALAAHPVLGRRLEGTVHARRGPSASGTAITHLADTPQIADSVRERVTHLIGHVAGGALGAAERAVDALDGLLDTPTALALDGIDEALDPLDLTGPLLRTLRAGLPDELGWPALDEAAAELTATGADIEGVTSTWPVLTLFSTDRAIAVDHRGRRGECAFSVPEDAAMRVVFHVGGDFLVGWSGKDQSRADQAYWASAPQAVFASDDLWGMSPASGRYRAFLGHQPETADGGGRHDGRRALRPGDRSGPGWQPFELLGDGTGLWTAPESLARDEGWQEVDPKTGETREARSLPAFFATPPPDGMAWAYELLSLTRLPEGVTGSPLGQAEGLAGFRVTHPETDRGRHPGSHTLEGVDGRRARLPRTKDGGDPWGIIRLPDGPDLVTGTGRETSLEVSCRDAEDGSLLWEVRGFAGVRPRHGRTVFPPPAFWHFLRPRDPGSSRALRRATPAAVRELLDAARHGTTGVREAVARVLPEVTDRRVADGVTAFVEQAAAVLRRRERLSRRVATVRSGALVRPPAEAPDAHLLAALRGLILGKVPHQPTAQPALVTAVASDGRYLDGGVDDRVRWLSRPAATEDWTVLLGRIDAVAWRLLAAPTSDQDRAALVALLRTWAEQPFARPGSWRVGSATGAALAPLGEAGHALVTGSPAGSLAPDRSYRFAQRADSPVPPGADDVQTVTVDRDDSTRLRRLLELLDERGPVPFGEAAVEAFARRTGVRRAVAALALAGLPRKAEFGGDLVTRYEAHKKMLRAKPFQATGQAADEAESLSRELGVAGRLRVLAAAMPDDPAELWAGGGLVAAAERMAGEWARLLGAQAGIDEATATQLEKDLGLGSDWAAALGDPAASRLATRDVRHVLVANTYGSQETHLPGEDGEINLRTRDRGTLYPSLGALLIWALTQRPVGHPAIAGVPELHDRLRARLDNPDLFLPLGLVRIGSGHEQLRALFGPRTVPVRPADKPFNDRAREPLAYDDGLLVVDGQSNLQSPYLRPAGFADPGAVERVARLCADHGLPDLLRQVRQFEVLYNGGLARMVARAANTPVPPGGYEANPLLSVPDLVDEVAKALRASRDAAALYLQLLTLARPTDRNVRTWNGWTAARHKAAQAELLEREAVVQDKRPRAGRTTFIPSGWTEVKAPHLPLETYKLDLHLAAVNSQKEVNAPVTRLLPPKPLHEMFTETWRGR